MSDPTLPDDELQEVHSLVLACLDVPDPEGELERRTVGRPHLRPLVRQALARARSGHEEAAESAIPERIGPFRIVRQLGSGGMGAVYLAEQEEPIARTVALKLVKLGMDTDEVLRRFEVERRTLALMNHDNIARVFDAGKSARGQPYFAMEYVPGTPITRFADAHALTLGKRLMLMLEVCAGVQHAHQRGIVHRDLKPANILVVEQEGEGESTRRSVPKIIDFGLARAVEPQRDATELTMAGTALGTPAYMSPEQASGFETVDTRTDVYALGVVLYELLIGELPFGAAELLDKGPEEMRRLVREVEPLRPSRKLAQLGAGVDEVARRRGTTPATLLRALQRDLDWIVMLALRKEREERYASVGDLAADLRRYLNDEPVSATAPSTFYRVSKLLRRHRRQAVAAGLVLASLVAGLIVSLVFLFEARFARDRLDPLVLQALQHEAEDELWPVHPRVAARMQRWLERAEGLRDRVPVQRTYLADLEAQASAAVATDSVLAEVLREQRQVVHQMADLCAPEPTPTNIAGVAKRLEAARTLARRTVDDHAEVWARARAAIAQSDGVHASTLYQGLDLPPQLGLVPLGMDPASELWEFYHPDSGEPDAPLPARGASGRIEMRPELGFVFVLVPGGTFTMGADAEHGGGVPDEPDEAPRHAVTLGAFFLCKYECTQAQWRRLVGTTPSLYGVGAPIPRGSPAITWTNPVESVLWNDVARTCAHYDLTLPTEAQWEYACRAGTTTRYSFGDDPGRIPDDLDMGAFANVADAFAKAKARGWTVNEPWDDGHVVHAPAGSFRPNQFGLHDLHGNVLEMCQDFEWPYDHPVREGDGLRLPAVGGEAPANPNLRIGRGGSWQDGCLRARSADRQEVPIYLASDLIGFRPARAVEGPSAW